MTSSKCMMYTEEYSLEDCKWETGLYTIESTQENSFRISKIRPCLNRKEDLAPSRRAFYWLARMTHYSIPDGS